MNNNFIIAQLGLTPCFGDCDPVIQALLGHFQCDTNEKCIQLDSRGNGAND